VRGIKVTFVGLVQHLDQIAARGMSQPLGLAVEPEVVGGMNNGSFCVS